MSELLRGLTVSLDFEKNYIMGDVLGKGTFGEVKKCYDKKTKAAYACKVILKKNIDDPHQLREEVRLLSKLNHYAIMLLRETYESKVFIYIVTELLEGPELFDRIVEQGYYSEQDAARAVKNILDGIAYLHERRIVHRDLKPENLMYNNRTDDALLKIVDFGLSAEVEVGKHLNEVCGSPGYIAPEVLVGKNYGTEADMWSLGVIAFILLSGLEPFAAESEEQMFVKIIHAQYEFLPEYWVEISSFRKDLVTRLLNKKQSSRLTARDALVHAWVQGRAASSKHMVDTFENIKSFNAKRKLKGGVKSVMAINRMLHTVKRLSLAESASRRASELVAEV